MSFSHKQKTIISLLVLCAVLIIVAVGWFIFALVTHSSKSSLHHQASLSTSTTNSQNIIVPPDSAFKLLPLDNPVILSDVTPEQTGLVKKGIEQACTYPQGEKVSTRNKRLSRYFTRNSIEKIKLLPAVRQVLADGGSIDAIADGDPSLYSYTPKFFRFNFGVKMIFHFDPKNKARTLDATQLWQVTVTRKNPKQIVDVKLLADGGLSND